MEGTFERGQRYKMKNPITVENQTFDFCEPDAATAGHAEGEVWPLRRDARGHFFTGWGYMRGDSLPRLSIEECEALA